ncbi:Fur family transcriptional regulator [Serinicoccus chungangensis]|uniref:Fur family transcriptional regulator n=1 Tax=Serinicoccus chungangensis TaxID=767452 RepID=A0A0W8I154_9MICO|nr:Fur family transcriptional regulator [Serinicoccus chungangensis]KUG51451.1 Fur family transcriptional regulator [Serinicoccus chungangensis]
MTPSPASADALRGAGLRVTPPRLAVLDTLQRHPHLEATDVVRLTRAQHRGVSVQGVYDVLRVLASAHLVRRIQPAHAVARYELDLGDNHHHVVCRGCEVLVDVPCVVGTAPCVDTAGASALGFEVDEAEVIYWGLCPTCRDRATHQTTDVPSTHRKEQV